MHFIPIHPLTIAASNGCMNRDMQFFIGTELRDLGAHHNLGKYYVDIEQALKRYRPYTIIDNGAYEGAAVTEYGRYINFCDSFARGTALLEIVIPDTLKGYDATIKQFHEFMATYKASRAKSPDYVSGAERQRTRLMAVPQGRNISEWLTCYVEMQADPMVDTIGIPKWIAADSHFNETLDEAIANMPDLRMDGFHENMRLMYLDNFELGNISFDAVSEQLARIKLLWLLIGLHRQDYALPMKSIHMLGLANFTEIGISAAIDLRNPAAARMFSALRYVRSLDSTIPYMLAHKMSPSYEIMRDIFMTATLPKVNGEYIQLDVGGMVAVEKAIRSVLNPVQGMPATTRPPGYFTTKPHEFDTRFAFFISAFITNHLGRTLRYGLENARG